MGAAHGRVPRPSIEPRPGGKPRVVMDERWRDRASGCWRRLRYGFGPRSTNATHWPWFLNAVPKVSSRRLYLVFGGGQRRSVGDGDAPRPASGPPKVVGGNGEQSPGARAVGRASKVSAPWVLGPPSKTSIVTMPRPLIAYRMFIVASLPRTCRQVTGPPTSSDPAATKLAPPAGSSPLGPLVAFSATTSNAPARPGPPRRPPVLARDLRRRRARQHQHRTREERSEEQLPHRAPPWMGAHARVAGHTTAGLTRAIS